MRQHTILGERILNAAPALRPVARLVRSTHERWDGTGYPDRLTGAEIPRGSRIVAVCDAYEAMTADRAYRSALTPGGRRPGAARQRRHAVRPRGRRGLLRRARSPPKHRHDRTRARRRTSAGRRPPCTHPPHPGRITELAEAGTMPPSLTARVSESRECAPEQQRVLRTRSAGDAAGWVFSRSWTGSTLRRVARPAPAA